MTLSRQTLEWTIARLENTPKRKIAAQTLKQDLNHILMHNTIKFPRKQSFWARLAWGRRAWR